MKDIQVILRNFESHRYSEFTLTGNLQIIWAKGNNVGKSAIFRALDFIVRVHKYNGKQIKDSIRWGESAASITCKYDGKTTELHLFLRNNTAGYLFVHYDADGYRSELDRAPSDLVESLDLKYEEDIDYILNMLEADKIQIIVDDSPITNGIMSTIFMDSKLEEVKANSTQFANKLYGDYNFYAHSLTFAENNVKSKSYNSNADLFFEECETLKKLATLAELTPNYKSLSDSTLPYSSTIFPVAESLVSIYGLFQSMSSFESKKVDITSQDSKTLVSLTEVLTALLRLHRSLFVKHYDFSIFKHIETINFLVQLNGIADTIQSLKKEVSLLEQEVLTSEKIIEESGRIVSCPMKGRVVFNEEKCIPYPE